MKNQTRAYIFAGLSVLAWSTVATAFKITLQEISVLSMVMLSSLFSTLFLGSVLLLRKEKTILKIHDFKNSLLMGFLNPFLYYIILFKAYSMLPAHVAQPVNMLWGIVIPLLSVPILKQKLQPRTLAALITAFLGASLLTFETSSSGIKFYNPEGIGLTLITTLIWSLYWIYNSRDSKDPVKRLFLNFLWGTVFSGAAFIIAEPSPSITLKGTAGALYIGLFEMGLTFLLWLKAMQYSEKNSSVSILIYISPFISFLILNKVLGEHIGIKEIAALILICTGIITDKIKKN